MLYDYDIKVADFTSLRNFSRMQGSRFTLGVWGLRVCSLDVAFMFATVRNRPREVAMAVPMASFATVVTFGGFRRRVASFRVAGVAVCDIPTCFITGQKSFCVAGAVLLHRFQKMSCSFRGRRSTLATSIVISRGRHNTVDVSRRVFFTNHIVLMLQRVSSRVSGFPPASPCPWGSCKTYPGSRCQSKL